MRSRGAIYCARLSKANNYGKQYYRRLGGRNVLRPYSVAIDLTINKLCHSSHIMPR